MFDLPNNEVIGYKDDFQRKMSLPLRVFFDFKPKNVDLSPVLCNNAIN